MAHTVAGVVVIQNKRYLMVQEKLEKCYGQWNWPAGWVDPGETPEQAAVREAKEEVGLNVTIIQKIGEWYDKEADRTRVLYLGDATGERTIQESEILGVAWLSGDQMSALRDTMRIADWSCDFISKFENVNQET